MHRDIKVYISVLVCVLAITSFSYADTVFMKDGNEEKGIVVENYFDRITLSTVDGEKEIRREKIKDILYDRREQNLLKLGDYHQQKGNIMKAYSYYKKAYQLNPDYKEAQDKFINLRAVLLRRPDKQLRDDIARKQALFKESGKVYAPQLAEEISPKAEEKLSAATGLLLVSENEMPKVRQVLPHSAAERAGIEKGDLIYSLWGKLTGYMELDAVCRTILDNPSPEIVLVVERDVIIKPELSGKADAGNIADIGFSLVMREGGLTIADVKASSQAAHQGLVKGDLVTAIDGKPTRYMPLKEAIMLIGQGCSKGSVDLEVIRSLTLWRKEL